MSRPLRALPAVILTLLAATAAVFNGWLFLDAHLNRALTLAILALETLVMIAAIWAVAVLFELRVFRPLRQVRDHLGLLLQADVDHKPAVTNGHGLEELPDYVEELGRQLARERLETARVMETAAERVDHRKSRLEAILRDLHEGVIVCNDDHRVVLFNQSAAARLDQAGPVGLHRSITTLLTGGATPKVYRELKEQYREGGDRSLLKPFTETTTDGRRLELRMSLIVESGGESSGYVLTFSGGTAGEQASTSVTAPAILSDRPAFYDFSLFDAKRGAGDLGGEPAATLDYVVFDTETTGLRPSSGDGIVQISGVRLVKGQPTGEEFDTLVNPGMPIPATSTRFHGITDDMVTGAPSPEEAVRSFKRFVEGSVLVAHNAAFDMKFLRMRESEAGVIFDKPVLDTLLLSFVLQPDQVVHTLDAIAARFGVNIRDEVRHTALGDARATAEIFIKMLPALERRGLDTLGRLLEASDEVLHIKREQKKL